MRKVPKGIYLYLSYTLVLLNSSSKSCNRGSEMAIGRWLMRIVQGVWTFYHTPHTGFQSLRHSVKTGTRPPAETVPHAPDLPL